MCNRISCGCFKNGSSCGSSPRCHCKNCSNPYGTNSRIMQDTGKRCCCGVNKGGGSASSCFEGSRCPCVNLKRSCSNCRCQRCDNKFGKRLKTMPQSVPTKRKLLSNSSDKLTHITGMEYLRRRNDSVRMDTWDITRLILLRIVLTTGVAHEDVQRITSIFNQAAQSLGMTAIVGVQQVRCKIQNLRT